MGEMLLHEQGILGSSKSEPLATNIELNRKYLGIVHPNSLIGETQENSRGIPEPPFLRRSILFGADSVKLSAESKRAVKSAAAWLTDHREVRILVVGYCDASESENCTHVLAERRGAVVKQFLVKYGSGFLRIVAVKGWERAPPVCAVATLACQAVNRRARIFIAGPVQ